MGPPAREGGTSEANARLEQLESSVANLLAGLAGSSSNKYPNPEVLHTSTQLSVELNPSLNKGTLPSRLRRQDNGIPAFHRQPTSDLLILLVLERQQYLSVRLEHQLRQTTRQFSIT